MPYFDARPPRYCLPASSLTPDELNELECFLHSAAAPANLRTLDVLHGFLTCVALSSSEIEADQWLPLIFSNPSRALFPVPRPDREIHLASLVVRMLDDIVLALADPAREFSPLVARAAHGRGQYAADGTMWSFGFLLGMAQLEDQWRGFLNLSDARCVLLPIFLLGCPFLPPVWDELVQSQSQRARLTAGIPHVVDAVHVRRFRLELAALKETRAVLAAARQIQ